MKKYCKLSLFGDLLEACYYNFLQDHVKMKRHVEIFRRYLHKMIERDKLDRINELARKERTDEGLTSEEKNEQESLRKQYLKSFREGLKSQLEGIQFVNNDGEDVTPDKIRQAQQESGLRDKDGQIVTSEDK